MIDWRPMTEWPPKKRSVSDQFLFWYPATANGRVALSARAVADNGPSGGRTPIRFAKIDPPKSDAEENADRVLKAINLLVPEFDLESRWWGPRLSEARADVLTALTGAKVPRSKAGFNAFREALYAALGVDSFEGTPVARRYEFVRRAAAILAGTRKP